jgi:hypothetical protein
MKHITFAVVWVYTFGLLFAMVKAEGLPDGVDLLIEAVRYRAGNHTLVYSLSYVTEQTYHRPTLTKEEIKKKAVEEEALIRKSFEVRGLPPPPYIDEVRDTVHKRYEQTSLLSRFTVKYKASSLSRKLLSLQIVRQGQGRDDPTEWVTDMEVIEVNVVGTKSESEGAVWFPQEQSAHVNDTQAYTETLLNFGRLQGPPVMFMHLLLFQDANIEKYEFSETNIAKFKAERKRLACADEGNVLQTMGTATYDGNAKAYIVESSAGDKVIERYWIDVNRGYVCPLLQYYDEQGKLLSEYKSRDYFLHEKSGLWFPQVYEEMTTNKDGKQEFKEYRIDKSSLDVNFPIADDEFLVEITEGSTVTDSRKGKGSQRYQAIDTGVLSLGKGGLDLDKMDWLAATNMLPLELSSMSWWRVPSIIAGVLFILWGFYLRFYRKT